MVLVSVFARTLLAIFISAPSIGWAYDIKSRFENVFSDPPPPLQQAKPSGLDMLPPLPRIRPSLPANERSDHSTTSAMIVPPQPRLKPSKLSGEPTLEQSKAGTRITPPKPRLRPS